MPKASVLQFDNYTVEELLFKKEPVKADQNEFQLQPHFEQEIVNLGDDKYDVHLSFDITPTEDHPMPFHIHVAIVGHFTYFDQDETIDANLKNHLFTFIFSLLFLHELSLDYHSVFFFIPPSLKFIIGSIKVATLALFVRVATI